MNFPSYIKTKRDAVALAAEMFPGEAQALARLKPDTTHPRYALDHITADTLRELLYWLHEARPKIYKRARWHFFYDVAVRIVKQTDANGSLKWSDIDARHRNDRHQSRMEAETMRGDGAGI
jgi:hypothetical protein